MRILVLLMVLVCCLAGEDLLTGFSRKALHYEGLGEWRESTEPVWVYAYHTLRLRYRAEKLHSTDAPVLTLRPGSVGPVTPGATNPENPFVAGMPVPVVLARDLTADGKPHTVRVELQGKMRTPQVDELRFTLPAGARLHVEELEFRGDPDLLPCSAPAPPLPAGAAKLKISAEQMCGGFPATSMRGKEAIRIAGDGSRARTLYLTLFPHFATVRMFAANLPPEKTRIRENREAAAVSVKLRYTDGFEEEQYPLSVEERRHVLTNRKAALYALELDPARTLAAAELMDRSAHAQLLLQGAALSQDSTPQSVEELPFVSRPSDRSPAAPDLSQSAWYKVSPLRGRPALPATIRAELTRPAAGRVAVSITNSGMEPQEFTLTFPSVTVRPNAPASDVYYLFPRQGAVIGREDRTLEAAYNAAFPLQFVDVFSPSANSGVAVIVRDNEGLGKQYRVRKTGASVEAEVDYFVRLAPGETFRPPEAELAIHGGDWHEGFAAYRKWVASWYKPKGPRPAWLQTAFWARRDYPVGGTNLLYDTRRNRYTYNAFLRDGEAFGGIDFIDISGWALSDKYGRVGDYPIELGGIDDFRRNIAAGVKAGVPTGLYFEGYLIDKNSKVGSANGPAWQLIDEKGEGRWWAGGSPEMFVCPWVRPWQQYLSKRVAEVARDTGVGGVYLDEFGFGRMRCYSKTHGHPPGVETLRGEIMMAQEVRRALAEMGRSDTMLYLEETPPDAAAPYYDAAFCYNLTHADPRLSPLRLNLSRFAFPDIRLWDMVSIGIDPRVLSTEEFRLSLWHGNGLWLKGHSDTWYGDDLLPFIRDAHTKLKQHAVAFSGTAEPLVASPHPAVFINRFSGGGKTVHTLFNASWRTTRFRFAGKDRVLGPRDIAVVAEP